MAHFQGAINAGDFGGMKRAWDAWFAEWAEARAFAVRRVNAFRGLGHAAGDPSRLPPVFLEELVRAFSGGQSPRPLPEISTERGGT